MSPIRTTTQTLLALFVFVLAGHTQEPEGISVHLKPDAESPLIGSLETIALAVNTDWPEGAMPVSGWQPIFYRGKFKVFISNDDLSKDLSPKPGSPYFLSTDDEAAQFALATKSDKAEIQDVHANHCELALETIVLAYIQDSAAPTVLQKETAKSLHSKRSLKGILTATGRSEKQRFGYAFKLVDSETKLLAYLDPSALPESLNIADYLNNSVQASGSLSNVADASQFVLVAQTLKKAK